MRNSRIIKNTFKIFLIIFVVIGLTACKENKKDTVKKDKGKEKVEEIIEEPKEKRMSIVMVGDALIHGAVYLDAEISRNKEYDFTSMFTDIKPIINKYDLRYYNQESIIGGKKIGVSHYPRLNSPEEIGEDLTDIGFNMVSLANNHTLDKGEAGVLNSLSFWKSRKGVITAGSYSSKEERDTINVYEQNGIKYAFLAYTKSTNGLSVPDGKDYYVNVYSDDLVKRDVEQAKANGAEVIIVSMHWGNEYTHTPTDEQREQAKYLSELGVHLIIGSHPHVIQPIEYVNDTLVIYSLGNFISAQRVLGQEKIIGVLVGTDIVVKDNKVTFENTNFELLYTYYTSSNTNFKVIPFSNLNDKILYSYETINTKYRKIVDPEGDFNGNQE